MTPLPEVMGEPAAISPEREALPCARPLRSGDACPGCGTGRMDYDGLLNLVCPECGYTPGNEGAFT